MKRQHRRRMERRRGLQLAALLVCAALILLGAYAGGRWFESKDDQPEPRGDYRQRYLLEDTIQVNGATYRPRHQLTTILVMGVDRDSNAMAQGSRNGGQADFLRLVVIDGARHLVSQLPLDRDTMTPITILGVLGNEVGERVSQLCLAHGFGDGKAQSSELTRRAVSHLLMDAPVDFYLSMNLDGISVLNDWAGGVTVTLEDDFSKMDASMVPGATVTLVGDQAEIYVRARKSIGVGTNEARMRRQQHYIHQLTDKVEARLSAGKNEIGFFYDMLAPYMVTDLGRGRMINEIWAAREYTRQDCELKGSHSIGTDGFMEFCPDSEALQQLVLELFYEQL